MTNSWPTWRAICHIAQGLEKLACLYIQLAEHVRAYAYEILCLCAWLCLRPAMHDRSAGARTSKLH